MFDADIGILTFVGGVLVLLGTVSGAVKWGITSLENKIGGVEAQIDNFREDVTRRFDTQGRRMARLEGRVDQVVDQVEKNTRRVAVLCDRVERDDDDHPGVRRPLDRERGP